MNLAMLDEYGRKTLASAFESAFESEMTRGLARRLSDSLMNVTQDLMWRGINHPRSNDG